MIALLALSALADPVALRAPTQESLTLALGAPTAGLAVQLPTTGLEVRIGGAVRLGSGVTELGFSVARDTSEQSGWILQGGGAAGLIAGPHTLGIGLTPFARIERRAKLHGGLQVALPLALAHRLPACAEQADRCSNLALRVPLSIEPFIGAPIGKARLLFQGAGGYVWTSAARSGVAYAQGTVLLGLPLGPAKEN